MLFTLITHVSDSSKMMMITTMAAVMTMMMMTSMMKMTAVTMEDRAHTMQWPVSLANGPSQGVKH